MATGTIVGHPNGYDSSSSYATMEGISNAYTDTSSTTYATLRGSWTKGLSFGFKIGDFSSIPLNATITSVNFQVKIRGANADSVSKIQLYVGNSTAKGAPETLGTLATSTRTISITNVGSWTREELQTAEFWIAGNNSSNIRIFGADMTVTYTYPTNAIYFKNNGAWTAATAAYKKVSGVWTQQSDLTAVFDSQTNYVKGN